MQERRKNRRIMDDVNKFTTLLGEKARFIGTMKGSDNCIVYGHVEGDCQCDGVLVLGEQGDWRGNISAPNVIISGNLTGNIDVSEQLEVSATAHIKGNISSPTMALAEGAVHIGEIRMDRQTDVVHFKERRAEQTSVPDLSTPDKVRTDKK